MRGALEAKLRLSRGFSLGVLCFGLAGACAAQSPGLVTILEGDALIVRGAARLAATLRAGMADALLFRTIFALRLFSEVWLLTQGGPARSTEVLASWAGLRVLPQGKERAFDRPREVTLVLDDPRAPSYLAVYGGKLTGYRATARRVLQLLRRSLPRRAPRARTTHRARRFRYGTDLQQ